MHKSKKKHKVQSDPEMKEIKAVILFSILGLVIGAAILANPDFNIVIPEFEFVLIPLAYAQSAQPPAFDVTNFNATARFADVLLEWNHDQTNTTDYFIENGSFNFPVANLKLDSTFDGAAGTSKVGPASELTNSNFCGSGTCNYNLPSGHVGTTQLSFEFAGATANTGNSIRWGLSGTAAAAINTTNISDWDFLNTNDWSITWWMFRASESGLSTFITSINDATTGSGASGGGTDRDGLKIVFDDNNQQVQVFTMENNIINSLNETSPTSFLEEDSVWHHYGITHDRGNELKWYKDGTLIETDSSVATSTGEADIGLIIGNCWDIGSRCLTNTGGGQTTPSIETPSRLDQILIYNSVLDSTDISTIYNGGSGVGTESTFTTLVPSLLAANGNITTTAYLHEDVPRSATIQYRITPFNDPPTETRTNGTGVLSNLVLTNDVPAQVLNLIASYFDENNISLDWDDQSDLGEGSPASPALSLVEYRIYDQDLSTPPFILSGTSGVSNFLDAENFPQEKEYKVSACNELGCGTNSTVVPVLAFPLSTPVLSASNDVPLGINATWTMANPAGIQGYSLFNSSDNNTFDLLATTINGTLFFFDTPHPVCYEQYYKVSPFTPTQNGTNSTTAFGTVNCVFSPSFDAVPLIENIGDTFKVSGTGTFAGGNLTEIALLENGTQTDIDITDINFTTGPDQTIPFSYLFWERDTVGGTRNFTVAVSGQSPVGIIDTTGSSGFVTREYDPAHRDAIVESQGQVNYTHFRFDGEDQIQLKVNRIAVPSGETWQIECIFQDVNDAIATKDSIVPEEPTVDWQGTWYNTTDTGYFNTTHAGAAGSHVYISCFNDLLLFSTTSYTNSSLALFGIDAFDTSFGSLIGVPSGIFMLVLMAGMANKRTSPTWIVVITGAAGIMSVVGFFSLEPVVWGLALLTAMLGMFVNQKVF